MNPFVFAVYPRPRPKRNGRSSDGQWSWQVWGIFVHEGPLWAPLAGLMPQGAMRSIASRRAVRSDQRLRCGSGAFPSTSSGQAFEAARRRFRTRFGQLQGTKKLRGSALKSLKQQVRVNLCATPTEGSQADDSR